MKSLAWFSLIVSALFTVRFALAADAGDTKRLELLRDHERALTELNGRQDAAERGYRDTLARLAAELETFRGRQAERRVAHHRQIVDLDTRFQAQFDGLRRRREQAMREHLGRVEKLDAELKSIQDKARDRYTEEVSRALRQHDEKRRGIEQEKDLLLGQIEDDRIGAINAYLAALAALQDVQLSEAQRLDRERDAFLANLAGQREAAAEKHRGEIAGIQEARTHRATYLGVQLHGLMEVRGRTAAAGPSGAGLLAEALAELAPDRTLRTTYHLDGNRLAGTDEGPVVRALADLKNGSYVPALGFGEDGNLLFQGKPLRLEYSYLVAGVELPLPRIVAGRMEQRLLAEVARNISRAPSGDFRKLGQDDIFFQPVDTSGRDLLFRDNPRLFQLLKAVMNNRRHELIGVELKDDRTLLIEGKQVRVKWLYKAADGSYREFSAKSAALQKEIESRWARQLQLVLTPTPIPRPVRERLAASLEPAPNEITDLAEALKAPERCGHHVILRRGATELLVARRSDRVLLLRAVGVPGLDAVACGPQSVAVFAMGVERLGAGIELSRLEGQDARPAHLAETENRLRVKGPSPALFVLAKDTLTLAAGAPEGVMGKVRWEEFQERGFFRVWLKETVGGRWIDDFTLEATADGSVVIAGAGSTPPAATDLSGGGGTP